MARRSWMLATVAAAALSVAACGNKRDRSAIEALEGLRGALSGNGDLNRWGDSRVIQEAAIFQRAEGIERTGMVPLSQGALDVMLADIVPVVEPRTYWQRARVYLRPGACVKIEDVTLPPEARTSQPSHGWQASVRTKHQAVMARLTDAFAADFRCGDGPRFTATFTRPAPVDGTLRVANITASSRGR